MPQEIYKRLELNKDQIAQIETLMADYEEKMQAKVQDKWASLDKLQEMYQKDY